MTYIENHDQVANSGSGERVHRSGQGRYQQDHPRPFLLLTPGTPMLFQEREFGSSSPFYFFADHDQGLRPLVCEGRIRSLWRFPAWHKAEVRPVSSGPRRSGDLPRRSKLDFSEQHTPGVYQLSQGPAATASRGIRSFGRKRSGGLDGAGCSPDEVFTCCATSGGAHRAPRRRPALDREPGERLEARPSAQAHAGAAGRSSSVWDLLWSSEAPRYGGTGTPPVDSGLGWRIPGHAAVALRPAPQSDEWKI